MIMIVIHSKVNHTSLFKATREQEIFFHLPKDLDFISEKRMILILVLICNKNSE